MVVDVFSETMTGRIQNVLLFVFVLAGGPMHWPIFASGLQEDEALISQAQAAILNDSLDPILQGPSILDPNSISLAPSGIQKTNEIPSENPSFLKCLLLDQKAIWTSPLHISKRDMYWILPFAAATGALIATDSSTSGAIANSEHLITVSNDISKIGAPYSTFGAAGVFYLLGSFLHDSRARETGILGTEALIDSSLVGLALKGIFQRERPYQDDGQGHFWAGGTSFPSGHAITTWSLAVVIAEEYSDHKLVGVGAFSVATLVSVARYTSDNHFLSDVLVGSVFGGLIGHYVYRTHHSQDSGKTQQGLKSHLMPTAFSPAFYSPQTKGLALQWKL